MGGSDGGAGDGWGQASVQRCGAEIPRNVREDDALLLLLLLLLPLLLEVAVMVLVVVVVVCWLFLLLSLIHHDDCNYSPTGKREHLQGEFTRPERHGPAPSQQYHE